MKQIECYDLFNYDNRKIKIFIQFGNGTYQKQKKKIKILDISLAAFCRPSFCEKVSKDQNC